MSPGSDEMQPPLPAGGGPPAGGLTRKGGNSLSHSPRASGAPETKCPAPESPRLCHRYVACRYSTRAAAIRQAERGPSLLLCSGVSQRRRSARCADRNGHPPSWAPVPQHTRGPSRPRPTGLLSGSRYWPGKDQAQPSTAQWRPHMGGDLAGVSISAGARNLWRSPFRTHKI
ncbi:hypothetical protein NDU88_004440 [Pleurodeles waltl]|uniref:Uncharacterized protein n=1 Tax=Pleurodeles waltl TaxID=8319 RepID=A0AAV7WVT5_PLEWA|nr:hypothetical protein NDU88_004440 [Pleurodeles waltl]